MAETLNITSLAIMGEGKQLREFPMEAPPPYSPRYDELQRMRDELDTARRSLAEKDEKMSKMSRIQDSVDAEVQELTEKLFQEAYKMVNVAEERREKAEKLLSESRLQVDVLTAEVSALKLIVQTPGMGKNHFMNTSPEHKSALAKLFSPSSSSSNGKSSSKKSSSLPSASQIRPREPSCEQREADATEEIDPVLFAEFTSWRDAGHPTVHHTFVDRIQTEEVNPCMHFSNQELASSILDSIAGNQLELEPVHEDKPTIKPCSLTQVNRFCPYKVRTSTDSQWQQISLFARNRIAAVCDYFTFVRYLHLGLTKSGLRDSYFDVVTLRKNMCLAKLGLGFVPKTNVRTGH